MKHRTSLLGYAGRWSGPGLQFGSLDRPGERSRRDLSDGQVQQVAAGTLRRAPGEVAELHRRLRRNRGTTWGMDPGELEVTQ